MTGLEGVQGGDDRDFVVDGGGVDVVFGVVVVWLDSESEGAGYAAAVVVVFVVICMGGDLRRTPSMASC